ncbi:hypothetical protein [Cytophaga hutchinsonii]|jgi:hypothetical protein|uniref:Transmembrane protein n=1 Tax=Cytophaga hutchinsonii (strain ATCC 33406 / DSM 1761 / CIP 103989 / NBRC 15051 / NCIMB 9469 / D465) TaxID=269798 RepID=A0A6N4SVM0_CYTH3|nr:hypothetical protein [Cytophaga hutchinsonii]ABG60418.1 conserved hypothetical protein [Cytophaga hutchinsonii ATCC 33406]SFX86380.1 hypothetical protein SAMN04487930_111101 [Cytophaga hutchinsonii ATCC 33406]
MTYTTQKNSWYYLSLVVSYLLHPVFIPTYIFTTFLFFGNYVFDPYSEHQQVYVVGLIFITTALIPLIMLSLNLLILRRKITNDELLMNSKRDRVVPFFYVGIYYCSLSYMFYTHLNFPLLLTCLMLIISAAVLVTAFISLFWKISAHALSLGASLMIFILIHTIMPSDHFLYVIMATLLLSGITLSSRLRLNAHTQEQTYAGYLLGILISALGLYFLLPNLFSFSFNL